MGAQQPARINPNAVDLSHFEILKVVGRGGFGKVNAVENRNDKQLYAMKTIEKERLLEGKRNLRAVWIERNVMALFKSNFLVHLYWALQDERNLYLIMNFMKGGDLRYYLKNQGKMTEESCRFYAAELLVALEEMNSLNIVYRDLKPENVLLDEFGHIRISDFGLCQVLRQSQNHQIRGESGTTGYMAPEVISQQFYNMSQDVWSYGVVLYEFLHHALPFGDPSEVLGIEPRMRSSLSPQCLSLLQGLLTKDPKMRLGCGERKWQEVKEHEWFRGIDWEAVADKALVPPFKPDAETANCEPIHEIEETFFGDDGKDRPPIDEAQQVKFVGFDYHTEFSPALLGQSQEAVELYLSRVQEQRKADRQSAQEDRAFERSSTHSGSGTHSGTNSGRK